MSKKDIKSILKETKKEKSWTSTFGNPTLEECDILYKNGVATTVKTTTFQSLFLENRFKKLCSIFSLEKN